MSISTEQPKKFQNGHSQVVRLPKEFRFSGKKVIITHS